MRIYETLFIVDPTLEEETRNKLVDRIKSLIEEKMGGKIRKIDRWGVRQLAFKVQKFNEGDYTIIIFDAEPSKIKLLEEMYRVVPEIFRHLILRREDLEKHPLAQKLEKEEKTEEPVSQEQSEPVEVLAPDQSEGENS